jgi:hypothetical protein
MKKENGRMSIHDAMSGIVLSLTARGYKSFSASQDKWIQAVAASMPVIMREAGKRKIHVGFRVRPDALHGGSSTMNEGLYGLVLRGLVTIDHPQYDVYRPTVEARDALEYFDSLPGDRAFYETLTSRFLEEFEKARETG